MKRLLFITLLLSILTACGTANNASGSEQIEAGGDNTGAKEEDISKPLEADTEAIKEESAGDESEHTFYADVFKEEMYYITEEQAELSQESYDFISENKDLFPAKESEDIESVKGNSETIDVKLLNKNEAPYHSTVTTFEGYVVQVEEENYDNGETAAFVNVLDDEGNNHIFYMYKSTEDILEEDRVRFWGLPVGRFTYETLDGGYQNSLIFFGSHIEKQ